MNYSTFETPDDASSYTSAETIPADSFRDPDGGYHNTVTPESPASVPYPTRTAGRNPPNISTPLKPSRSDQIGCCGRFEEFWIGRTDMERWMASIILTISVICIGFFLSFVLFAVYGYGALHGYIFEDGYPICRSSTCVQAAGQMLRSMDPSVSPCDNFFKFACGGWEKRNVRPSDSNVYTNFFRESEGLYFEIKEMLEAIPEEGQEKPYDNLRKGYKACMNESLWEEKGVEPLVKLLQKIGLPPILDSSFDSDNFDWKKRVAELRRSYYESHLISIEVELDFERSSDYVIYVDVGPLPLPQVILSTNNTKIASLFMEKIIETASLITQYLEEAENKSSSGPGQRNELNYLNPDLTLEEHENDVEKSSMIEYILQHADAGGPMRFHPSVDHSKSALRSLIGHDGPFKKRIFNPSNLRSARDIVDQLNMILDSAKIWDFYVELAKITNNSKSDEEAFNRMNIEELQSLTDPDSSRMDWLDFIRDIFSVNNSIVITQNTEVVVTDVDYFKNLMDLVEDTPKEVIANAIMMMFSLNMGSEVSPTVNGKQVLVSKDSTSRTYSNIGRKDSRIWLDCTSKMNSLMGLAVTSLYVRKQELYSKETKQTVQNMVDYLHETLISRLKEDDWMPTNTHWQAVKKAKEMINRVAFPDEVFNETVVNIYYDDFPDMDDENHFNNMMKLQQYYSKYSLTKINSKPSRNTWISSALTINAFYDGTRNSIHIPFGILRPPFFWRGTIPPLMYGAIGAAIGHEMFHGFDVNGRKRNWKGNLDNWWTNESLNYYLKRARCFVDQYGQLPVINYAVQDENGTDIKVDGELTNAENIADSEGLHLAWSAFQALKEDSPRELKLIGMEQYNEDQLFFIAYGQIWCSSFSDQGLKESLSFDVHTPGLYRVHGALRINEEFRETFNCPIDSPMVSNVSSCPLFYD